jgi:energy-coupling factor transport system permease protein
MMSYDLNTIQKLDVRTKMAICVLSSMVALFLEEIYPLSVLAMASIIYALLHRRFLVLLIAYGAIVVMGLMAGCCIRIMTLAMPAMGKMELHLFFSPFLRVIILINVILALAFSTRVQAILTALKTLRLPLVVYLPVSVMIRFIPSFIVDIKQISESLKMRGYRINPLTVTFHPLLTMRLLFVPVVVRALRSSDELAIAAELKGVGYSDKISYYKTTRLSPADYYAGVVAALLVCAAWLFEYQDKLF